MPVRVGSAGPYLSPHDGIQRRVIGKRHIRGGRVGEDPDSVPSDQAQLPPGQRGRQLLQSIRAGIHTDPVPVGDTVERLAGTIPVTQQTRAHCQGVTVTHQ